MLRTVVGEVCLIFFNFIISPSNFIQPTGTSTKFVNMTERALQHFEDEHGVKLEKITKIPLEGDGTIDKRVERYVLSIASYHFKAKLFILKGYTIISKQMKGGCLTSTKPTPSSSLPIHRVQSYRLTCSTVSFKITISLPLETTIIRRVLELVLRHFHPRLENLKRSQGERPRYNEYAVWRFVGSILGL